MQHREYQVAVILINYNSSHYTLDCVKSVFEKTDKRLKVQVIVIDNNSRWDEFEKLSPLRDQADLLLFRSNLNVGFSGANMMGVQFADADYYYFLNNDCVLLNDCISILHSFMESHCKAANCSGEMFIANGEYEYNFRYFPSLALKIFGSGLLRLVAPEKFPSRHVRFSQPTKVDLVNGSSMFIRATAFEAIGGFDTNYFLYCEEEDIALRLRRVGFSTYLVPEAKYQHFVSRSSQSENSINLPFLREFYISLLYYFQKNYGLFYRLVIQCFYFFKIGKKFYKSWDYARLAFFILKGAHFKYSMRMIQKISDHGRS